MSGIDIVDGTPVLDIKPYIPQYDNPSHWVSRDIYDNEYLLERQKNGSAFICLETKQVSYNQILSLFPSISC